MNGEWIFQVALVLTPALVSASVGYLLGKRSQKLQIIREYVTKIVTKEYPELFSQLKKHSEMLDNFLNRPNVTFYVSQLNEMYDRGLDEFMKTHHKDLFLLVDSFHKSILPKFNTLDLWELMKKTGDISSKLLRESLPSDVADTSEQISLDLSERINQYYIIPDLLTGRDDEVRNKIENCVMERTAHIYREKAKRPFRIRGQTGAINYDQISKSLLEQAKPEIKTLVDKFKELKKQNDEEVKEKLLPLLQKYIRDPI